jgi:RHS repeat-associated protein
MKKIAIIIISLIISIGYIKGQSNTENYLQTRVYLEPVTNTQPTAKQKRTIQYLDGLARPFQTVEVQVTPSGKDLVTPYTYDFLGRQLRVYLPIPRATSNGNIHPQQGQVNFPVSDDTNFYNGEKIFSEKQLENSPFDRILSQKQVGNAWNTKPIVYEYGTNKANIDGIIKKYTATFNYTTFLSSITSVETYSDNQLVKNTIIDEDGNKTVEFKNEQDQIILLKKFINSTESTNIYYVYNDYDQLAYVIPPIASTYTDVNSILDNLCYQYKYDQKNRLVEKKLPGKGWEYMVYDKQDRLVLTRDAVLEAQGKWLFTKYDQFSRPIYTGILDSSPGRAQQVVAVEGLGSNNEVRTTTSNFNNTGMYVFYTTNLAYPQYNYVLMSVNYYDTYPNYGFNPIFPTNILGEPVLTENPNDLGVSTKSLPVMSLVKNIEDDNWTKNYTYYDKKGRAIGSYSINHLGGRTKVDSKLDFAGVFQQTVTTHKRLDTDTDRVITENFTYDSQNRLLKHSHKVDNNLVEILAENTYNELSQLKNKQVGRTEPSNPLLGSLAIQSIDYQYNIRGWMTKINDPANLNGKLFGYELRYNNPISSNITAGRFNGNITEVDWNNGSENLLKRYNFDYDKLNRLASAYYREPSTGVSGSFNEYLTYDPNGNINTLKRFAPQVFSPTPTLIDDLEYQYTGNRLDKVIENIPNSTGYEGGNNTIDYDLNGNMITMQDKGIQDITYNHLNLPDAFGISQVNPLSGIPMNFGLSYLYRADGTKVRKTNSSGGGRGQATKYKRTDYLDGFQYSLTETVQPCAWCRTSVAYEQEAFKGPFVPDTLNPIWILDFVPTAEGFYSFTENRYIYQYRDHLGNARVSYAKNSSGALEITDTNNYYAFGMNHIGGMKSMLGAYQNYKYNGKELQETGMYDYGARFYMPDIGRWGVMDPLAEMYRRYSPYNYTINNPINFTDPDGRWVRGAGFWNNLTKSDARIHAEQWADKLGSGNYNVSVDKGNNGTWTVSSHTLKSTVKDSFNSNGLVSTLYVPYSQGGGLGTAPSSGNAWGPTISSIPESRGKTEIQMQVSENPLVQSAAIDLLTAGTGKFIRGLTQVEEEVLRVGHLTPWSQMTKAERRAFQHSYRKAEQLDLPIWRESEANILQELFNNKVTNIRSAGANGFFNSRELLNGVKTTVNRTEPVYFGEKYYYYETLQGKFISAGKMP